MSARIRPDLSRIPGVFKIEVTEETKLATAAFFAKRAAKANPATFRRFLNRKGGEAPRPDDELPSGYSSIGSRR